MGLGFEVMDFELRLEGFRCRVLGFRTWGLGLTADFRENYCGSL